MAIHSKTLQEAKYKLRTATGISEQHYSHCLEFPIYGSGQGSGNSPCIWLFISSTLFDIQNATTHGARFVTPDGQTSLQVAIVGFVDDSNGMTNDFQPQHQAPITTLLKNMEQDAQKWSDLLFCSGGQLELSKCSFHTLHFEFMPNGRPIPQQQQYPTLIRLRDPITNDYINITSLRVDQPHKTLGHYKAPSEPKQQTHFNHLMSLARRTSILLSTSPISRAGALLAYHTVYVPRIKYSLPQCYFTPAQLDKALQTHMGSIIAKCGFNRHSPTAVMYASPNYAGAGFLRWQVLQGEGQILLFLKHWRSSTIVSRALHIALAWAQWQAGISNPILMTPAYPKARGGKMEK